MKKYHDQTVIDNTVQRIKSKNEEEIKELKEFFIKELKHAKIMVKKNFKIYRAYGCKKIVMKF